MVRAANFDDDPLRALKGVRMAVKLGFAMGGQTLDAIRARAPRIVEMAAERVTYELSVILSAGKLRDAIDLLRSTHLAEPLDLHPRDVHADDVSLSGAYALLVDDPRDYAERWRWSTDLLRDVVTLQHLIEHHDRIALYDAGETSRGSCPPSSAPSAATSLSISPTFRSGRCSPATRSRKSRSRAGQELGRIKRALLEGRFGVR